VGWWRGLALRVVDAPLRYQIIGIAGALVAASGLVGGLDGVSPPPKEPTIEVGTALPAGPWTVTVTGARLLGDSPPLKLEHPGDHWVVVLATVEITADKSHNDIADIIRLREGTLAGTRPDHIYLVRDTKPVQYLHPGLPERVAFIWELAAGATVPTALEVLVYGETWRIDSLTDRFEWLDLEPHARLTVPVEDKRT
jgi:hypothetical protein